MVIPEVSFIIVSWNTQELTRNCIESIFRFAHNLNYELIVVDNASVDGSVEYLEKALKDKNHYLIKNQDNFGFAHANNQGYEISKGKYIALINSDIRFLDVSFLGLIKTLELQNDLGAISCDLKGDNGLSQSIHRRFPTLSSVLFTKTRIGAWIDHRIFKKRFINSYLYKDIDRNGFVFVEQAAAALLIIKRSVIKQMGVLFSERFPVFGNDVDLCKRICLAGFKLGVDYDVVVWHKGSASVEKIEKKVLRNISNNWLKLYFELYSSRFKYLIVKFILS